MDLFVKCKNVESKDDLIQFIKDLRHDLQVNPYE